VEVEYSSRISLATIGFIFPFSISPDLIAEPTEKLAEAKVGRISDVLGLL
jgi:hypothetical protein